MLDDCVRIIADDAAMALVTGLGAAGLGVLPLLLAVRRGGLDEVREVFSGRCSRSTSSISSSRLSRSSSLRPSHEGISEIRPAQEASSSRQAAQRWAFSRRPIHPVIITFRLAIVQKSGH